MNLSNLQPLQVLLRRRQASRRGQGSVKVEPQHVVTKEQKSSSGYSKKLGFEGWTNAITTTCS